MIAEVMVDTNVLVYAASTLASDADKARIARDLLFNQSVGLSAQVMQEFLVVSTRKVRKGWSLDDALDWIEALEDFRACRSIHLSSGLVRSSRSDTGCPTGMALYSPPRTASKPLFSTPKISTTGSSTVRLVSKIRSDPAK